MYGEKHRAWNMMMGRYVFFMDADDVVDVTLFSQIVSSLEENPAQAVVFGADRRVLRCRGSSASLCAGFLWERSGAG